jgi:hypothetical protein
MSDLEHEQPAPGALTHTDVRNLLHEYATDLALGRPAAQLYPDVAAHLAQCPACRHELANAQSIVQAIYTDTIEPAPSYPSFSLAAIKARARPPTPEQSPPLLDQIGRLVIQFSKEFLASIRQTTWQGTYAEAHQVRQKTSGPTKLEKLYRYDTSTIGTANISCLVEVFAEDRERTLGTVIIQVIQHQDSLDQPKSDITLQGATCNWQSETDEWGYARFEHVPLDMLSTLRLEIQTNNSGE